MKPINDFQLSKYFNLRDFQCRCGCQQVKLSPLLLQVCEELRDDSPLLITSGYRCPAHNRKVGGHKKSHHLYGEAADLKPTLNSLENLFILATSYSDVGGLGIYNSIIHIDLRETGRIFWVKLVGKKYKYFTNVDSALKYWRRFTSR